LRRPYCEDGVFYSSAMSFVSLDRTITAKITCFELLCKTFKGHVKLLNFTIFQSPEYQQNKKFYVKRLPLVENFICSNFAPRFTKQTTITIRHL